MTQNTARLGIISFGEEFLGALDPGRPGRLGRDFRPMEDAGPATSPTDESGMSVAARGEPEQQ